MFDSILSLSRDIMVYECNTPLISTINKNDAKFHVLVKLSFFTILKFKEKKTIWIRNFHNDYITLM